MTPTVRARARRRYDHWAPILTLILGIIGVTGIVLGAAAIYANEEQDDRLLACFDRYATANAEASQAVRDATELRDGATAARDAALNREGEAFLRLTRRLLGDRVTPDDVAALSESLELRARAGLRLEEAQAAVDKARRLNPIPDPPSVVCARLSENNS